MLATAATTAGSVFLVVTKQSPPVVHEGTNIELVIGILMFLVTGILLAFGGLLVGWILRPNRPHPVKSEAYECGEPAIGPAWIQFDLRFYTVALVFIVFDVEVALLWPWAVAFKNIGGPAFWAFLVFFLLIAVPFLYEWHSGYLNWVRASTGQKQSTSSVTVNDEAASVH